MKVIVVVSDDWVSRFSKPMKVSEVRNFTKKMSHWKHIRYERKYNICEFLVGLINFKEKG